MKDLDFRQIHLDFHTSENIEEIGKNFSKEQFQKSLQDGHVGSINLFAKCHHGWAYHPTEKNIMHPHLSFDLFGEMVEAAKEIGVGVQTYISAGLDEKIARKHPDWLFRHKDESTTWVEDFLTPGYHLFCMNSPYLDVLLDQIEEVVINYETEGIWLDIVGVRPCYCQNCMRQLIDEGKSPRNIEAVLELAESVYKNYTDKVKEVVEKHRPNMRIFHNSGHLIRGRRDLAGMNTHLELESLPTGNYGYDHFPLSARYAETLDKPYLSMTGKFHTNWGEFGGYKHPNALIYETSLALAHGAYCSIGDQMHPDSLMDEATYHLIGEAYRLVEEKESYCKNTKQISDIAFLSIEATKKSISSVFGGPEGVPYSDLGALRILQEGHYLFDIVDVEADFNAYKVLILPDEVVINDDLSGKIHDFLEKGGKILATGASGLNEEQTAFAIDMGVKYLGVDEYKPSYFKPNPEIDNLRQASFVMYEQGYRVEATTGKSLGICEESYFNREVIHFCSHMHTPNRKIKAYDAFVKSNHGIYIAWEIFKDYGKLGSYHLKAMIHKALDILLADNKTLEVSLPAQCFTSLRSQENEKRIIHHIVYASPIQKGSVSVVEDLLQLYDIPIRIRLSKEIKKVYLAPQMQEIPFEYKEGIIYYNVPKIHGHQMIVLEEK
ncbi:beta-galactosidase trimerization domain-containing protein [Wukongibacter baidiensis]|uniref:beta-galactosidase trimerization domain-containing protein n=1 Tax=Wukongibacter baidiensis TaxID=1723361 RepID=UPI003D7FBB6A